MPPPRKRALVVFDADEGQGEDEDVPWSLESYPYPDKKRFGKRKGVEYVTAECRMFWKRDNSLAFRAGMEYAVDIRDQLLSEEELHDRHSAANP